MGYIDETWYVGSDGHKYYPHGLSSPKWAYLIPHLHICSNWLITKKSTTQSSVWATLMKFGMWVAMDTCSTHVVCRHNCAYLISHLHIYCNWLITVKLAQSIRRSLWMREVASSSPVSANALVKIECA